MQALKMFTGGQGSQAEGTEKEQFIGMAMGQAAQLFDKQQQNSSSGNNTTTKEEVVANAAKLALKMYMKGGVSGGSSGSGSGGGSGSSAGGLLNLASKFLK